MTCQRKFVVEPVFKNGFTLFRLTSLDNIEGLSYGIFGRSGGVSPKPYDSLNVAFSTGDDEKNIITNIELIRKELDFEFIASCNQVHGKKIVVIDKDFPLRPRKEGPIFLGDGDAIITNLPRIGLMIKTGDCQAVILVDPVGRVIANVHCGWRGNVQNIVGEVVRTMKTDFSSNPENIIAAISPSIGPCCAEFIYYREIFPEAFWHFRINENHFNLWEITLSQLIEAGLSPKNISISGWCTRCHPEYFFSYRREKRSGRMATVVGWRG
ncbi:MAG: peptidoglycan editing factor PgeF [Syntrophobacterales bacterium]|nr:peptidoglycan editing factor PgeF [Syntrophobacterales bacterium]